MKKFVKQLLCITLVFVMVFIAGCSKKDNGNNDGTPTPTVTPDGGSSDENGDTEGPKEIVTLKFGTHYVPGLDPHYKDDVTGEYVMPEADREARYAAEKAILDELGVVFEYVEFTGNTTEVLLQSVMANDPISDIAWMWGGSEGTILAQNVLQQLDSYAYLFEDEEYSWMLYDKMFGHHYFIGAVTRFTQRWPLVFNIDYIEAVDSLKDANGNTIYPTTLFEEGKWTWSTFKDYLQKINAYYANSSAPNRPDRRIDAYQTDYRFAALSASYAAGGSVYGPQGLGVNSQGTKKGVAFIAELMKDGLLWSETYDNSITPGWTWNGGNFQGGESVFTDIPDWFIGGAVTQAADRGQSIGIVPWPREDSLSADSDEYNQVMELSDSIGILKGISPERTELALKALRTYFSTYYAQVAGVDNIKEFKDAYASTQAATYGFDIFHEQAGDSILEAFKFISKKVETGGDYSGLIALRGPWDELVGKSLFGTDGTPAYDVAIEANMQIFDNVIADMTAILSQEGVNDNISPNITTSYDDPLAIPAGTTMEDPVWAEYIKAEDNVDGVLDFATGEIAFNTDVDFNVVGEYKDAFKIFFTDSSDNKAEKSISFIIYNPNNTTAPTVTPVAEPAPIAVDAVVADIVWKNYIESAVDADGFDITRNITADISELDTTTPGTYDVKLTVTDFAGNTAETVVTVTVANAE